MLCWPLLVTKSMDSQTYHFNLLRHWFLNNYYISVYLGPKIWGHLILLANYLTHDGITLKIDIESFANTGTSGKHHQRDR